MTKRILIVGGNGQLGNCIRKIAPDFENQYEFNFTDSQTVNITDRDSVSDVFYDFKPHFCINASAYTAVDLAEAIMKIIEAEPKTYGIFHFSNYPETTWFEFAQKIAEFSGSKIRLNAITTEKFPTPAKRPKRSTMSLDKIEETYKIELKHWENTLQDCIETLQK